MSVACAYTSPSLYIGLVLTSLLASSKADTLVLVRFLFMSIFWGRFLSLTLALITVYASYLLWRHHQYHLHAKGLQGYLVSAEVIDILYKWSYFDPAQFSPFWFCLVAPSDLTFFPIHWFLPAGQLPQFPAVLFLPLFF